jgi:hypothetical protein
MLLLPNATSDPSSSPLPPCWERLPLRSASASAASVPPTLWLRTPLAEEKLPPDAPSSARLVLLLLKRPALMRV